MGEPVFEVGQVVESTDGYCWHLTKGKRYTVTHYQPSCPDLHIGFTWPAYVTVIGDSGRPVTGHTYRFRAVQEAPNEDATQA